LSKNTRQIENEIKKLFNNINNSVEEEYRIINTNNMFFEESDPAKEPGTYVYADSAGYHLDIIGDRGGIAEEKIIDNLEDLYFELCWTLVSSISTLYASKNRIKGRDWRRIMFAKRIELLENLNFDFGKKGKTLVDEILENAPYNDELLGRL